MAEQVNAGAEPADVANEHRVGVVTVLTACRQFKVPLRNPRAARRKLMAEMAASGESPASVAAHFAVCVSTVCRACKEHGVQVVKIGSTTNVKAFSVLFRLLRGEKQQSIARHFYLSRQYVNMVAQGARAAGFTIPSCRDSQPISDLEGVAVA